MDKDKNNEYKLASFQTFEQTNDIKRAFKYGKPPNFLTGGRKGLHVAVICTNNKPKVTEQIEQEIKPSFNNSPKTVFDLKAEKDFKDALWNIFQNNLTREIALILLDDEFNERSLGRLKEILEETLIGTTEKIIILLPFEQFEMFKNSDKVFPHFIETVLKALDDENALKDVKKIAQLQPDSMESLGDIFKDITEQLAQGKTLADIFKNSPQTVALFEQLISKVEEMRIATAGEVEWKKENIHIRRENDSINIYYSDILIIPLTPTKGDIFYMELTNGEIVEGIKNKILKFLEPMVNDIAEAVADYVTNRGKEDNINNEKTNPSSLNTPEYRNNDYGRTRY